MTDLVLPGRDRITRLLTGDAAPLLAEALAGRRHLVVTDQGVARALPELIGEDAVVLAEGERAKDAASLALIHDAMLAAHLDRRSVVVGIGGGKVCDIAAFAASTWMRGCPVVLVPTTLLAQVDASIGGKTAINHGDVKNLLGSFWPAETIVADPSLLATLPHDLVVEGSAELLKHALIGDRAMFEAVEAAISPVPAPVEGTVATLLAPFVADAMRLKMAIVAQDPLETGVRAHLNLGHTLGHAVESATGVRHGVAVGLGLAAATEMSVARGLLAEDEAARIVALLRRLGLPTRLTDVPAVDASHLLELMAHDKKVTDGEITLVLLQRIGQTTLVRVPLLQAKELIDAVA